MIELRKRLSLSFFLGAVGILGAEIGIKQDWALVIGILGLAAGVYLKLGSLEGRMASVENSVHYLRNRMDGLAGELASTREEVSALCATRSSKRI